MSKDKRKFRDRAFNIYYETRRGYRISGNRMPLHPHQNSTVKRMLKRGMLQIIRCHHHLKLGHNILK